MLPPNLQNDQRRRTHVKKHRVDKKTKKKDWSPGQCPNKSIGIRLSLQQGTLTMKTECTTFLTVTKHG